MNRKQRRTAESINGHAQPSKKIVPRRLSRRTLEITVEQWLKGKADPIVGALLNHICCIEEEHNMMVDTIQAIANTPVSLPTTCSEDAKRYVMKIAGAAMVALKSLVDRGAITVKPAETPPSMTPEFVTRSNETPAPDVPASVDTPPSNTEGTPTNGTEPN